MSDKVNSQTTDAVTQTNVTVLGESPAQAMSMLYQMASHASGISIQNSVTNQQNLNQLNPVIIADAIKILKG
ncbi:MULTISPECIES: RebB family R body protein [unclassified Chryseobacterium]|uniref:RebB family R body protein n=1 Tax=unclassified Chryseobacterium TaxID=2593645 RepID=UPI00100B6DCC|nr:MULTISPECIES: RebB family R body protein [unclassified Chryseobacterium]RXM51674.1 RebB like protein [Chryseobacterium sp. CH25]RXM67251.1 RebB like protein [Chryseobacterium sp. CH1]